MKKQCPERQRRNPERGAVAIVIGALWATLFGLAALSVDVGYYYQSQRNLQDAADAAVMAGLPQLQGSQLQAQTNATQMLTLNGYTSGVTVTPAPNSLEVDINKTMPNFFGSIFGLSPKMIHVKSVGQINPAGPSMLALGGCPSTGLTINGGGTLNIAGPVQSNGILSYSTGPATTNTAGAVQSSCVTPTSNGAWNQFPGGVGMGPNFPDPYIGVTTAMFACKPGTSLLTPIGIQLSDWTGTTLTPGIYCSSADIDLAGPGTSFIATGVTLVSMGHIQINAANASTVSANPSAPDSIVAYALGTGDCTGPAVNIGNNSLTLTGVVYAPNGCVNMGGTDMTVNGSIVGGIVNLGDYGPWTFNALPGGSGSGFYLAQ